MTIELRPGESTLIGHDTGDTSLALGESVTVTAVPAPPPVEDFLRSIAMTSGTVTQVIRNKGLINPRDHLGYLTGSGKGSLASVANAKTQIAKLRAAFPDNPLFIQTAGTWNVDLLARAFAGEDVAIAHVIEPGFGSQIPGHPEPWVGTQAGVEALVRKGKAAADAQNVTYVLHLTGQGVSWRTGDATATLDYAKIAAIVGPTAPFISLIQTQRDWQSTYKNGSDRAYKALDLVEALPADWLGQVTLQASEVNGITYGMNPPKPGGPAAVKVLEDYRALRGKRARGTGVWCLSDETQLKHFLSTSQPWTAP